MAVVTVCLVLQPGVDALGLALRVVSCMFDHGTYRRLVRGVGYVAGWSRGAKALGLLI